MTRKHFEAIAAALKASRASVVTVHAMCNVLAGMNPRFDRQRFLEAAEWRRRPMKPISPKTLADYADDHRAGKYVPRWVKQSNEFIGLIDPQIWIAANDLIEERLGSDTINRNTGEE